MHRRAIAATLLVTLAAAAGCAGDDDDGDGATSSSDSPTVTSTGPLPSSATPGADSGADPTTTLPTLASEAEVEAWFLRNKAGIGQQIIDMGTALEAIGTEGLDPQGCQQAVDTAIALYESDILRDPAADLAYVQVVETFSALASDCTQGDEDNVRAFAAAMVVLIADFNTWSQSIEAPTDASTPAVGSSDAPAASTALSATPTTTAG